MNIVTDYPALASSAVAGVVIDGLAHAFGTVPDVQQDAITGLVGWIVPLLIPIIAGLFTHRRVTTVPPSERGL